MKSRIIPLVLVPIFALSACSQQSEPEQIAVPNNSENVTLNSDGSMSQNSLLDSYNKAKEQGYTGTMDQWVELTKLYETNPQQAQQVAQDSGFSGGEMLMGALAGAAVGALAANAMSSKTNMASNTYSAQRANGATNYAYSQPLSKEEEERRRSTGGYSGTYLAGSNATGSANTSTPVRPSSPVPTASTSSTSTTTSTAPRSSSFTSVSRGGFGGAVSSGG